MRTTRLLTETPLLDFGHPAIEKLVEDRQWLGLDEKQRIRAAYDFVRNEIPFGYNSQDAIPTSKVLSDGYGQCNTKAILLMALFRALDVPCRLRGFTIFKDLQRGVVPELVYPIAPARIIHSWVEINHSGEWLNLEGFILDDKFLSSLQHAFAGQESLCAYGAGTHCLSSPDVEWQGGDTYIQSTGIADDLGLWDDPDTFYAEHGQAFGILKDLLYRYVIRHWMNVRVKRIRSGIVPTFPKSQGSVKRVIVRTR